MSLYARHQTRRAQYLWSRSSARKSCVVEHRVRPITTREPRASGVSQRAGELKVRYFPDFGRYDPRRHPVRFFSAVDRRRQNDPLGSRLRDVEAVPRARTPRDFGPSGDALGCDRTMLFQRFERRYSYLLPITPPAEECLLVPFHVGDRAVGTLWAIMHSDRHKFDGEDERLMIALGQFASVAYQMQVSMDDLTGANRRAKTRRERSPRN